MSPINQLCILALAAGALAVPSFRNVNHQYNHQHKHSGLKFVTPAQRHDGRDATILAHRKQVYEAAKERHPERWTGETRDWNLKDEVWLNPERNQPEELRNAA